MTHQINPPKVIIPEEDLVNPNDYLPIMENNCVIDCNTSRTVHPIIPEILKGHPLNYTLTRCPKMPLVYLQQFWHTAVLETYGRTNPRQQIVASIDEYEGRLSVRSLREALHLHAALEGGYEEFSDNNALIQAILEMGYNFPFQYLSHFARKHLLEMYFVLFSILDKCMTSRHTGFNNATHNTLLIFEGIVYNKNYDYAALIFEELIKVVDTKIKGKGKYKKNFILFSRFFSIFIKYIMDVEPRIPMRSSRWVPTVFK